VLDSGSQKIIIPDDVAKRRGYSIAVDSSTPFRISGFDGSEATTSAQAAIGNSCALVLPASIAADSLFSVGNIVDEGYVVCLDKYQATIFSSSNEEEQYRAPRDEEGLWRLSFDDLEQMMMKDEQPRRTLSYSARLQRFDINLRDRVYELHNRMNHPSVDAMCAAVEPGEDDTGPAWTNSNLTPAEIRRVFNDEPCLICALSKRNLDGPAQVKPEDKRVWGPGECLCADPVPLISPAAINCAISFFAFTCMGTGNLHCPTTKSKDTAAYIEALDSVINFYRQHGHTVKVIRTDAEFTLNSDKSDRFLAERGIRAEHSSPYRHHQNGAERYIQTIIKATAATLHSQPWLRADFWSEALRATVETRNRTPNSKTGRLSPWQIITGEALDLSRKHKYAFGDFVVVGTPKIEREGKFDTRNDLCIYIGQPHGSTDSHRVYHPFDKRIVERGSVMKIDISDMQYLRWYTRCFSMRESQSRYQLVEDAVYSFFDEQASIITTPTASASPSTVAEEAATMLEEEIFEKHLLNKRQQKRVRSKSPPAPPPSERQLRSSSSAAATAAARQDDDVSDDEEYEAFVALAAKVLRTENNPTLRQALASDERDKWVEAIEKEIESLMASNTIVPLDPGEEIPRNAMFVHTTTQLKRKLSSVDGSAEKWKARTCARGDMIKGKVDASQTYSPTINALTFACVFQIAIIFGMVRRIMDTVSAYLHQFYPYEKRPLILQLERGVAEVCNLPPQQRYKVFKYIYGLPDAGRAYYEAVSEHLIASGYRRSKMDPCLFIRATDEELTFVMLHVDDTIVFATNVKAFERLEGKLKEKFDITINEDADAYLGVHLESLGDGSVRMTQPKLLQAIFKEFPPQARRKPATSPTRQRTSTPRDETPIDRKTYLHLLGELMYLTKSRPDIQVAISFGATKSVSPTAADYDDLLHVVGYLRETQHLGLILHTVPPEQRGKALRMLCMVDASYLIHLDSHSHTGYTISFGSMGTFYSKSSKQQLVATSSTHAEMRALYTLATDIVYVIDLCADLGVPLELPAIVFEDNYPVVQLVSEQATGIRKCKHFQMIIAYVRELVNNRLIEMHKIASEHNTADMLSKPTFGADFKYKRQQLLGIAPGEEPLPPPPTKSKASSSRPAQVMDESA